MREGSRLHRFLTHRPKNRLASFCQVFYFYYHAAIRLELYNKAASLSYYTIISIFPMILVLTALSGYVFPPQKLFAGITYFLETAMPLHSELIMTNLKSLFQKRSGFSWFGLAGLLVSAQMLYVNMEKIINRILHIDKRRNFFLTRLFFFFWLFGMVFVLLTPFVFELASSLMMLLGLPPTFWGTVSVRGGFFIVGFSVFCLIMIMLPTQRIPLRRVVSGAILFALTLQIGKFLFKMIILRNLVRYNLVYGSLSSIVLGLLWVFYFYNMFLFFVYWTGRTKDPKYVERKGLR